MEIYYSRFGVLARPIIKQFGFDYNRVYYSVEAILEDFYKHGWEVAEIEKSPEPRSGSFYTFSKRY